MQTPHNYCTLQQLQDHGAQLFELKQALLGGLVAYDTHSGLELPTVLVLKILGIPLGSHQQIELMCLESSCLWTYKWQTANPGRALADLGTDDVCVEVAAAQAAGLLGEAATGKVLTCPTNTAEAPKTSATRCANDFPEHMAQFTEHSSASVRECAAQYSGADKKALLAVAELLGGSTNEAVASKFDTTPRNVQRWKKRAQELLSSSTRNNVTP